MNILSLFDGHSGCQIALNKIGLKPQKYYAAEIDKYAIKACMAVYPNTIQLGSVTDWQDWDINWSNIDLVTGGFPCQAWSMAGKQLGDKDERGMLFWTMLDIMKRVKFANPKVKFLIENVKMKKEFEEYITYHTEQALGEVCKTLINSALVSAQNRNRYYWTNWHVEQPEDKGILLKDIIESQPENPTIMSDKFVKRQEGRSCLIDESKPKASNLSAMEYVKNGRQGDYLKVRPCQPKQYDENSILHHVADATDIKGHGYNKRVYAETGKAPTLAAASGGNLEPKVIIRNKSKCVRSSGHGSYDRHEWDSISNCHYRKLTPRECGRLQTVPEEILDTLLSSGISNSQLYKMFGNGWTIDVIGHIFSQMESQVKSTKQFDLL